MSKRDDELLDEASDSIDELRELVTELNEHTMRLRTEIAVLIELIAVEQARRHQP